MPGIDDPLDKKLVFMAFYVITAIFVYISAVTFITLPDTGQKYADMAVPFLLGSGFGALIGFYFAGSPGMKSKDDTIRKIVDILPPTPPTISKEDL